MTGQVTVAVPWGGAVKSATIYGGKWRGDSVLERAFGYLHLLPGHHADRDLELALMAVKYFGGKPVDQRPPSGLGRMPK